MHSAGAVHQHGTVIHEAAGACAPERDRSAARRGEGEHIGRRVGNADGDCVIINAVAAEIPAANSFIVNAMRELFAGRRTLYFKRYYASGRTRPAGSASTHSSSGTASAPSGKAEAAWPGRHAMRPERTPA